MAIAENIKKLPKNACEIVVIPLKPFNNTFSICYTTFRDCARYELHKDLSPQDAQETALRYLSILGAS